MREGRCGVRTERPGPFWGGIDTSVGVEATTPTRETVAEVKPRNIVGVEASAKKVVERSFSLRHEISWLLGFGFAQRVWRVFSFGRTGANVAWRIRAYRSLQPSWRPRSRSTLCVCVHEMSRELDEGVPGVVLTVAPAIFQRLALAV